jgi:hypothetical protein
MTLAIDDIQGDPPGRTASACSCLAGCGTLVSTNNENLLVVGLAKATHWQATLISRYHHRSAALQAANRWLAHQADAVVRDGSA